ncbi:ABTB1 protein, partial [Crocuta crocuta]
GARCEANTFDGERCLYGALSDAIRRALREYKQVTASCRRRDYYDDFLQRPSKCLGEGLGDSGPVRLPRGASLPSVLGPGELRQRLPMGWGWGKPRRWPQEILGAVEGAPRALSPPLLHPGRLDVGVEHVSDCERLAKQCQLWDLLQDLEAKCEKVSEFVASKPGTCVKVLTIEPPPAAPRLREDMAQLAHCALPPELRGDLGELPFPFPDFVDSCPDVCFRVEGCRFLCHKAFFCGRSDYFRALLDDHFRENEELEAPGGLPAVTLHGISPGIFSHVLYYIYSDHTEVRGSGGDGGDRCWAGSLQGPKGRRGPRWLRGAGLLEAGEGCGACGFPFPQGGALLVEREDFVEAVREEAAAVAERQETDSIPLVDDIRFHVASTVQTYSAIEEARQRLRALEDLLVSIGLDC